MAQKFVNNLTVKLIGDITTTQTTITVDTTSRFPLLQLGDWFYLTITDKREGGELRWEVVKVNSWTGTTLTCVRAQDGTTAQSWLSGSELSLRITAADMFDYEQLKDSKGQINGIAPLDPAGKIAANYLYDVVNSSTQTALDAKLPSSSYTAADVLAKIKTVDGAGSGLDADTLDGMQPATSNTASTIVQRDASGNFSAGTITAALSGNASTATTLRTARTISLSGDVTGSVSFDGSADATITASVADGSHNHVIANVDGLQTVLDAKLPSASYTAADVLAKVKTVDGAGSGLDADLLDGQQGSYYAPINSPAFTGTPTAPTAAVGTNTTQLATTAFVKAEIANDAPTKTGTGASGTWGINITGNAATVTNGVYTTGNQTIAGVKTFSSSPIVPTATTATQAINSASVFGFKNHIINGNFDIWERATSQTTSGYGSDDRWVNLNIGSTKTHSKIGCTDTERALFNASAFSRTVVSSVAGAGNAVVKAQYIEDVTKLAGKTVTLSFWAKANSNKNIAIEFGQRFGTGGTPSADLLGIGSQLIALTTTWQKKTITVTLPSIVGKTLGTDGVDSTSTRIVFWFDAGSSFNSRSANLGQQSGTFDIAQVQLEEGSVATPFEQRPIGLELSLCQRYFEITQVNVGQYGIAGMGWYQSIPFKVTKRVTPTVEVGLPTGQTNIGTISTTGNNPRFTITTGVVINTGPFGVATALNASAEL